MSDGNAHAKRSTAPVMPTVKFASVWTPHRNSNSIKLSSLLPAKMSQNVS